VTAVSPARRRRIALYAVPVTLLFLSSVGFEITRTSRRVSATALGRGIPCLAATSAHTRLPVSRAALPDVLSDGDVAQARRRPLFWYVTPGRSRVVATSVHVTSRGATLKSFVVGSLKGPLKSVYDVAAWSPGRTALFAMRQKPQAVAITVVSLGGRSRVATFGNAPDPSPPDAVHRDFFVARLTGPKPDLFVIDRNATTGSVTLSVFSGESHFAMALIDRRPVGALAVAPPSWGLDVARVGGSRPSLLLFRNAAGSFYGRPEVHILSGASGFRVFTTHSILSGRLAGSRFLVGPSLAGPAVYALRRVGTALDLRTAALGVPVASATC
jgi:hypothetical protein